MLLAVALTVAWSVIGARSASADSACTSLPISSIADHWFTGGFEDHVVDMSGARGFIRTYNPFVANAPPILGSTSAWVMAASGPRFAQVGWAKDSFDPATHDPLNAVVFIQFTGAAGEVFMPRYFSTIFPPDTFFYQVNKPDPNGPWGFHWGATQLASVQLNWTPTVHEAFVETQNFSGDQTAGDRTAHATFGTIQWSDFTNWQFSAFGGPGNPYQAGTPNNPSSPDRGTAGFDALTATDGSNFDTWDARCPP